MTIKPMALAATLAGIFILGFSLVFFTPVAGLMRPSGPSTGGPTAQSSSATTSVIPSASPSASPSDNSGASSSEPSPQPVVTQTVTAEPTPSDEILGGEFSNVTPTVAEALMMTESEAEDWLINVWVNDGSGSELPAGVWVPQLSSKCAALSGADLQTGSQFGYSDGIEENYSYLGSNRVLAFHQAMRARFGPGVVLVSPSDYGADDFISICDGTPLWVTLVINVGSSFSPDAALQWCDEQRLPVYECGARPLFIPGETSVVGRS